MNTSNKTPRHYLFLFLFSLALISPMLLSSCGVSEDDLGTTSTTDDTDTNDDTVSDFRTECLEQQTPLRLHCKSDFILALEQPQHPDEYCCWIVEGAVEQQKTNPGYLAIINSASGPSVAIGCYLTLANAQSQPACVNSSCNYVECDR